MDKQMIEEMEKDIAVRMAMAKGIAGSMNKGVEGWLGEYLIEKGWAKILENAVVLTEEELTERDYERYNLGYETHRQESQKREDYIETLSHHINDLENALLIVRMETAEKFAERLKDVYAPYQKYTAVYVTTIREHIDKICKEITEEVKCDE